MSTERQYIARISYGKDSLKMLEVIHSRGLPLDRITTTDVWATDTISANLPPMDEFKARMDQRIWDMYHIEVEHLCALNPDGTKKTYEQMFYHVPVRKNSQSVQVERERERAGSRKDLLPDSRYSGILGARANLNAGHIESKDQLPAFLPTQATTGARSLKLPKTAIKGFPLAKGITWWLVGLKLTDDDKGQCWTEEQICELRGQNLYKFIEWARSPWGSKITEVKALSAEFNIIDDICDLVRSMQSE